MKSVGETMAIGRTFKESFQKALRGLEVGSFGFGCDGKDLWGTRRSAVAGRSQDQAHAAQRAAGLVSALRDQVRHVDRGNPRVDWHRSLVPAEPVSRSSRWKSELRGLGSLAAVDDATLRQAKQFGFSDRQLATILHTTEMDVRADRKRRGIVATFKSVDTCAAEFEAYTPYYYSTYEDEDETPPKQPGSGG